MPYYPKLRNYVSDKVWDVNPILKEYKNRKSKLGFVIDNIIKLKDGLRDPIKGIPPKTLKETFLLATWNIREFDSNGKKQGPRLEECYYYMAEIISCFDLVAIQEVKDDLGPLRKLKNILGPNWDFIVTDITEGRSGNDERIAFMFDKGTVSFCNVAGEIVLPDKPNSKIKQFARTPFLVSFQSGWLKLNLCSVHIYFGSDSDKKRRIKEIEDLSVFMGSRAKADNENYILLGDFNIVKNAKGDKTMDALLKGGFKVPPGLQEMPKGSNLKQDKYYDQIAYKNSYRRVEFTEKAGIFNLYEYVFTPEDMDSYLEDYNLLMKANKKKTKRKMDTRTYNTWKTFQMSDHLPMWCEFKIDFSRDYLKYLKTNALKMKE
jgi:endonuclease/exonuclease/phosphatase family metal-dependent hydrolase